MAEHLRHFGLWLDRELDAELIEFLTPYADKRRIGELFRNAINHYRGQQSVPVAPRPTQMALPIPKPELVQQMPAISSEIGDTRQAKQSFKSAFKGK
jgi:hypothetical protein